jgi:hypothetical protein
MKLHIKIALVTGAIALTAGPAALAAGKPEGVPPTSHPTAQGNGPAYTPAPPGPKASLPEKAKAYGVYCRTESKQHVAGEPGTAFSRCVTKMAKAATHPNLAPGQVCKGESRKHVKGEKGTAFSRCVKAAAQLRRHEHEEGKA